VTSSSPIRASTPDAGLFGPESITWRIHADPSMLLGGFRALMLQPVHPLVMAGRSGGQLAAGEGGLDPADLPATEQDIADHYRAVRSELRVTTVAPQRPLGICPTNAAVGHRGYPSASGLGRIGRRGRRNAAALGPPPVPSTRPADYRPHRVARRPGDPPRGPDVARLAFPESGPALRPTSGIGGLTKTKAHSPASTSAGPLAVNHGVGRGVGCSALGPERRPA
jgi:hypothetical protein